MRSLVIALVNWIGGSALIHFRARTLLFRAAGMDVNLRCRIGAGCRFRTNQVTLGWRSTINAECLFDNGARVSIGRRSGVAPRVSFITSTHEYENPWCRAGATSLHPITIGDGVWIGTGATILGGITVGDGAVVAAGAMVTKDVEPHTVVAGIPARVIRKLSAEGGEPHPGTVRW